MFFGALPPGHARRARPRLPKSHSGRIFVLADMKFMRRSTDGALASLIKRAQHGDLPAFQELYRILYPIVSRYVLRRLGDRAEAEDVLSHTFEQLVAKLGDVDGRKGGPLAFVCGIARNRMIDLLRTRKSGCVSRTQPTS